MQWENYLNIGLLPCLDTFLGSKFYFDEDKDLVWGVAIPVLVSLQLSIPVLVSVLVLAGGLPTKPDRGAAHRLFRLASVSWTPHPPPPPPPPRLKLRRLFSSLKMATTPSSPAAQKFKESPLLFKESPLFSATCDNGVPSFFIFYFLFFLRFFLKKMTFCK